MATKLERGVALLRSLACDHHQDDMCDDHTWRECRLCLTIAEVQDHRMARMALALVLADYDRMRAKERKEADR